VGKAWLFFLTTRLKTRLAQDISALSLLNMLPLVAVIFTVISGAQCSSAIYWIASDASRDRATIPTLDSIFVFSLMVPILIRYKISKRRFDIDKGTIFSKLSITCFVLGSLLIASGIALPMLSYIASGGPLIIAGLLATLLNNRSQLKLTERKI